MTKRLHALRTERCPLTTTKDEYRANLHALQVELVKLQKHFIHRNDKILVLSQVGPKPERWRPFLRHRL